MFLVLVVKCCLVIPWVFAVYEERYGKSLHLIIIELQMVFFLSSFGIS